MKTFTVKESVQKGIYFNPEDSQLCNWLREELKLLGVPRILLHNLDWDDSQGLLVKERLSNDRRALVCVQTAAGVGGTIWLTSNVSREEWSEEKQRVTRLTLPIGEAVGVETLHVMEGEFGTEYLVAMQPGASLRIRRSGELGGAPSGFTLLWNGRWSPSGDRLDPRNWGMSLFSK